jgi:hypothetical protein
MTMSAASAASMPPSTAEVLLGLVRNHPGERIALGDIVNGLAERVFGFLLLLCALPNACGAAAIPGLSTVFGLPMAFFAGQMMLGQRRPWLPRQLLARSLARADFELYIQQALPYLERVMRYVKPRWPRFVSARAERFLGGVCLVLGVVLALPIPGGNLLPGIASALIALAIVERDGRLAVVGVAMAILSLIVVVLVVTVGVAFLYWLAGHVF